MLTNSFHTLRLLSANNSLNLALRLRHKKNTQTNEKEAPKVAADVVNYLESSPEYRDIKDKLPKSLLRKYQSPESMYLINKETAKEIADKIKTHLNSDDPLVEVNPGLGFLTRELLRCHKGHLHMFEISSHFKQHLEALQKQYPNRVSFKIADFLGMWKLAFLDKIDQGSRIKELLGELATEDNDRIVKIVGSMPGLSFVKHLIYNIVFLNTDSQLGRPDLFITMPGHRFEFLTDDEIRLGKHRSIPTLFQLLFDYKILANVPTVHFLPWTNPPTGKRITMMDEYRLYLVNITRKKKMPCPPEYLPLLWYFFKPQIFSKNTRVVPMLEQWIPGCGVWLITGQDPPDTKKEVSPGEEDEPLPHMTIFTEFGDLTLRQKLTVFKRFISWPEFEQCQFRVTMENNLPKFVTQVEDNKSPIGTHIDDIEHSDSENDSL